MPGQDEADQGGRAMNLYLWGMGWGIPVEAVDDLRLQMGLDPSQPNNVGDIKLTDETSVQNMRRLQAAREGRIMWRNNVGAIRDERGVPVRYGLANDSAKVNKQVKSSDLIGITPILITPEMVGAIIGQFTAEECKRPGWKYTGDEHEAAQLRYLEIVVAWGGAASFTNGVDVDVIRK